MHVGQGTDRGPISWFPVWTDTPARHPGYVTGPVAQVDVAELAGAPRVDQVVVINRSDRPALLLGGELLEGGWQHRALVATALLAPGRPTVQPVRCVEEGRWSGDAIHSRRARHVPAGVLPRLDDQGEVWRRVRGYGATAGPSKTESLGARLDRAAPAARELTRGLRPLPGQRGVVVGIAGRPVMMQLFDNSSALKAHWTGLLQAAVLESLGKAGRRTPASRARAFMERVERTELHLDGPAGLARRFRGGHQVRVDATRWHDRTVHFSAVPSEA
jgi:hypothetical protein